MEKTLEFPELLALIDERSAAFRAAVAAAPGLGVVVPSCPQWTLFDLVRHLGDGRRKWAAIVAAGPADAPPAKPVWESDVPRELEPLLAWSAESTRLMLDALREAGPAKGCWAWWDGSQSPSNCGAAARHQVQEVAVHTWDAQLALGTPQPLPDEVALDGVDEFLSTSCAGPYRWPHDAAAVDYHATEGRSWRLSLSAGGVSVARLEGGADNGSAAIWGTAAELVLVLYGRIPVDSLKVEGDASIFNLLLEWDPDA
jgi:uncharacterized protein (TIGR03083 family)